MTSDRPDIHTSLCERQAWVITAEYLDPVFFIKERFVALLDPRIDGATLLHITNHLYMSTLFALDGQPSLRRDETRDPHPASFLILNDGSLWEDHIICGHEPGLWARRVCDITVTSDSGGVAQISWREPHIIVLEERREVEYWEEMTLPMLTDWVNEIIVYTKTKFMRLEKPPPYHFVTYSSELPPNKVLQRTPLRVDRDRGDFDGWNRPDSLPDLERRRR